MKDKGKITSVTIGNLTYHIDGNIQKIKEGETTVTVHFDKEQIEKYVQKQKEKLLNGGTIEWIEIKQAEDDKER